MSVRHREVQATSTCRVALLFWQGLDHLGMDVCQSSAPTCMHQEVGSACKGLLNPQGKIASKDSSGLTIPQDNLTDATKCSVRFHMHTLCFRGLRPRCCVQVLQRKRHPVRNDNRIISSKRQFLPIPMS